LNKQKIIGMLALSLFLTGTVNVFAEQTTQPTAQKEIASPFKQVKQETKQPSTSVTPAKTVQTPKTEPAKTVTAKQPVVNTAAKTDAKVVKTEPAKPKVMPILDPKNPLSLAYSEVMINKTFDLIQKNKLVEAKAAIEPTYTWLNDATEYHTGLYKVLKDLDTAQTQADLERDLALKYAILRDKAGYQLALLYIEDNRPKDAVKKLVDIVRSQPTTKMGFESYQILQQLGFTYKAQLIEPEKEEIQEK
jgi:hypothetical protein